MNKKIYDRLVAQAKEAKELGLIKLAEELEDTLKNHKPEDESISEADKSNQELFLKKQSIDAVWNIVFSIIDSYKLKGIDVAILSTSIDSLANDLLVQAKDMISNINFETRKNMKSSLPGEKTNK